jgi:hypothetical protein
MPDIYWPLSTDCVPFNRGGGGSCGSGGDGGEGSGDGQNYTILSNSGGGSGMGLSSCGPFYDNPSFCAEGALGSLPAAGPAAGPVSYALGLGICPSIVFLYDSP